MLYKELGVSTGGLRQTTLVGHPLEGAVPTTTSLQSVLA